MMNVRPDKSVCVEFWGHNVHGDMRLLSLDLSLCTLLMAEARTFEDFRMLFLEHAGSSKQAAKVMAKGAGA